MIALAWRSGLRIGEVLALRPKDVDLAAGTLVVQHGKGDRRRVVGLDVRGLGARAHKHHTVRTCPCGSASLQSMGGSEARTGYPPRSPAQLCLHADRGRR